MAVNFELSSSQYLEIDENQVNSDVFTISVWIKTEDFSAAAQSVLASVDKDAATRYYFIRVDAAGTVAFVFRNTSGVSATTSTTVTDGVWHNIIIVNASTTDRRVYIDNAGVGTNTTLVTAADSVIDRFSIGRIGDSSPGLYFDGDIAEPAIYSGVALGTEDRQALADGVNPLDVKPQNIEVYRPMYNLTDHNDVLGNNDLTAFNTPTSSNDHPPVQQPIFNYGGFPVAAVAGGRIMGSLAGYGGLAGHGGIAGPGGGLAG